MTELQAKFQSTKKLSSSDLSAAFLAEQTLSSADHASAIITTAALTAPDSAQPRQCPDCRSPLKKKQKICSRCQLRLLVEIKIAKKLITRDQWRCLLAKNSLPGDIKQLTDKQAHAARLKLDEFLKTRKLLRRLSLNTPPATITVPDADNAKTVSEESISGAAATALSVLPGSAGAATSPARHITSAKYRETVLRQGSRCYWCWQEVVRVSEIPKADRIKDKYFTLVFCLPDNNQSRTVEHPVATVDHLVRVADGGTNHVENLVIACLGCNQRRGREAEGREFETSWFFGSKSNEHGFWQQCPHCQADLIHFGEGSE